MRLILSILLLASGASAQWEKISVPTQAGFRGLSVVSEKIVWASGTEGTVIRTLDAGKTWSVMTVAGAEKLDFRGIRAFDDKTAVIISSGPAEKGEAHIYRTADGGKSWKQVLEEKRAGIFFDAVAFWDRQHGIVLSDPVDGKFALFTTSDGGASWREDLPTTPRGAYLSSIANVWTPHKDSLFAVGSTGTLFSLSGTPWGRGNRENLNSVAATRGQRPIVWAVGAKGLVMRSPMATKNHSAKHPAAKN